MEVSAFERRLTHLKRPSDPCGHLSVALAGDECDIEPVIGG
jgi:hypothetical protein